MKRALILTVGEGTRDKDIVPALLKMIEDAAVERVVLVYTRTTMVNAGRIRARLGIADDAERDTLIDDETDLSDVFSRSLAALRRLRREGFAPEAIDAEYTSGTKPMSAGLVLAAVTFG
jgi:hypothetical protein